MKKSALCKDIIRDIRKSLGRFISIVAIIALGVAFFSGVKVAPEVMEYTADKYYDDYNLMDIRLVSTLGLTEDDLKEINKIKGIKESLGTYTMDALAEYNEKEVVLRVHGFTSANQINGMNLIEGRLPEKVDECIIEAGKENFLKAPIGSKIKLFSGKEENLSESLKNTEFTVVGAVQTPYYLSFEKGSSDIGNGQVRDFIMIPQENFKLDIYTDIFLTVEGAKKLNSYGEQYFDVINPVIEEIKELAKEREKIRYNQILIDAQEELEKGKREYFDEKANAEEKLEDALREIEETKEEINNGEKELKDNERKFNLSIKEGKEKIEQGENEILKGEEEYKKGFETFNENKILAENGFIDAENEIRKGEESITLLEKQIVQINLGLENPLITEAEKEKLIIELQTSQGILQKTKEAIENGKLELAKNKAKIIGAEKELEKNRELLNSSRKRIEIEKTNFKKGEQEAVLEFQKAREKLETGKKDLAEGEKEYNISKEKAHKELEDAWKKIQEGENDLKKIEKAKWYVLDRKSHYSYVDYGGAADRIDAISQVFPVFFALVAALVCLTTMTRMVDEQRTNIGTLKALGYNKGDIAFKYIFYALTATVLGSIIGIAIGYTLFPTVIFNAYGIMYILPPVILKFNILLASSISLGAIGLTTITTFVACNNELKENASSLMRPKAPRLGKRILLEKIPFIWNKFNFSYKVSIRNIFRYKRRFFMTVFGIAGCTALMLTAFGIKDSIKTIVNRQFGVLFTYDMTVGLENGEEKHLKENKDIIDYELISRESGTIISDTIEKDISIITPRNTANIDKFIQLQSRKGEKKLNIEEKGVVITEQISKALDVDIGDEITLVNNEKYEARAKITGITENYTFNYVYISPSYYEEVFQEKVEFNEAIGTLSDTSKEFEDKLSRALIKQEGINSVSFNTSIKENFEDTIRSLNYVVVVMIISAGVLAFVVLYNLTNVNISERIREIATIKVLGFYDNEVSVYIYRENTILTVIGALAGLIMGIFLHRFIMTTVEMDNIMFGLKLEWKSYIFSILLTLIFAILVNFAMYYKLKKVEMVESLKSVD
ncbi:FtsX-like permease family protein [Tissierella sp. MB52-C2]|uniref:FtsX-like permease family protein n=1 Tax=Tissierella sp. MB52-C2 TaxID=3070999 RepID=UPI00280A5590|nr:FtsX-like permease family protein [Tissierella sp. MB52-C2]WMM26446.1 FtsX-like permease family protein [Tissierella sp. MB52-C2]